MSNDPGGKEVRYEGLIKMFDAERGFGFINRCKMDIGQDFYFRRADLDYEGKAPKRDMVVTFVPETGPKGRIAARVRPKFADKVKVRPNVKPTSKFAFSDDVISPPYRFVPVSADRAIWAEPVLHDGTPPSDANGHELLSGELRCTLTALTPLLAANVQFTARDILSGSRQNGKVALPSNWDIEPSVVDLDKTILEPLRDDNGRVLIAGEALKGMLRQSLGALMSAPMERVAERTYSYRPNLDCGRTNKERLVPRAAVVVEQADQALDVLILEHLEDVVFVQQNAQKALGSVTRGARLAAKIRGVELIPPKRGRSKLIGKNGASCDFSKDPHKLYSYRQGIDGTGQLRAAFGKSNSLPPQYKYVMVSNAALERARPAKIEGKLIGQYYQTQEHLADSSDGHLRNIHPLSEKERFKQVAKDVRSNTQINVDQLIYVECTPERDTVTSYGHHFRYRWRYSDSVRQRWQPDREGFSVRRILSPLECEQQLANAHDERGEHAPPKGLSGARLLFGYASGDEAQREEGDIDATGGIGKGDFKQLAGRLSFNMAIEQQTDERSEPERFLNSPGFTVPLKVLGTPRPSAVEYYLQQGVPVERNGRTVTYGDSIVSGPESGELNGRKFYLHQPNARDTANAQACFEDRSSDVIKDKQAALARFVSTPGTTFRFTLRFRDLRAWELGAVLSGLDPSRLHDSRSRLPDLTREYLDQLAAHLSANNRGEDSPPFALKLGHGRPLGLGSIRINVDGLCFLDEKQGTLNEAEQLNTTCETYVQGFADRLKDLADVLSAWFTVHRYAGRSRAEFPKENGTTFGFHTGIRRAHAKARRTKSEDQTNLHVLGPIS